MSSIFVTGTSGLVGRSLVRRLDPQRFQKVFGLSRTQVAASDPATNLSNVRPLRASLFDISRYERELAATDAVVHLAAATGKATPEEYEKVNVEGTRILTEQCRKLGVPRFLFVSSIAVRFPHKKHYPYARSKENAEAIVRASGLRTTILRPTIVLGQGAPAWAAFARLACGPVIPVFGDGTTLIQPIYVDDLADFIVAILESDFFSNETFELGGPEVISIENFLGKIHARLRSGKPRTLHIPLTPLFLALGLLEKVVFPLLPFTAGQLSAFRYPSTIEMNRLFEERRTSLKTIDEILDSLCPHAAR